MHKCDIIIPVWNQLENTRMCIDSIRSNTSYPYRLIVIDNASDIKTRDYLEGLKNEGALDIKLVTNSENQGFIKAVNKGISISDNEYVCLLNNDTVVAKGWLNEMAALIERNPRIGIINPSSNTLGQRLPDGVTPDELAEKMRKQRGLFVEIGSAFGFCMFMKRSLFNEIGLFDEVYGMGNFEDTDLSLRAKEKSYITVRSFASYVYHKEKQSFNLLKNFKADFDKNKKIFESKWGKTERLMAVLKKIDANYITHLKNILEKHAKENSWVYIISPHFDTKELFENFSNITFYHYNHFFYVKAFLKILFKKKKINLVYSDSDLFARILIKLNIPSMPMVLDEKNVADNAVLC